MSDCSDGQRSTRVGAVSLGGTEDSISHTHVLTHTRTVVIRRRGGEKNNNQTTHISVILFKFRNTFGRYGTNYAVKGDS